jgi:hypothetical protein
MGTDFREFCRTSRLQKPALKCQAELGAVKPRQCRNYFRTLAGIYTAAYKQDNFAVVDKVIKQFDEQIIMSPDKSFLLSASPCKAAKLLSTRCLVAMTFVSVTMLFSASIFEALQWSVTSLQLSAIRWTLSIVIYTATTTNTKRALTLQHTFIIRSFRQRTRFMLRFLLFTLDGASLVLEARLHPPTGLQWHLT